METINTTNLGRDSKFPFARWTSLLMGAALLVLAFAYDNGFAARANGAIVGFVAIAVAMLAMFMPAIRRLNTLAGAWIIVSTLFVFHEEPPYVMWIQFAVGAVLLFASLARSWREPSASARHARLLPRS